jgi:malate dehydrogenase (oxaloacetate-decarboxylating)
MTFCDFKYNKFGGTEKLIAKESGFVLQQDHYINRGTAFTTEERDDLGLSGALPPQPRTLDQQILNSVIKVDEKQDDVEKYIYIRSLFDRNVTLAHALISSNITKYMSIIYTPTVGLVCQRYSSIFRHANGIHLYPGNIHKAEEILRQYAYRDIRVAVVTDNQGILGIGDQGTGGIAICLGKLMLYTQGAGIAPWHCLPISLDIGTDNQLLLQDKNYLGWREKRLTGQEFLEFIDIFATAFKKVFPHSLCQWEDFSKQNAFAVRDKYVDKMISFNDDIQGTGAITLSTIIAAMRIKKEQLTDQVFLIHGAGAGGIGVAEQIYVALTEAGLNSKEALARVFTTDSKGLVISNSQHPAYKDKFSKSSADFPWITTLKRDCLQDVINQAKVTVLIGTSGQPGSFTKDIIQAVLANTDRPMILPLSNPTQKCEATPEEIIHWTEGKALIATGSPFSPVIYQNTSYSIAQCNNVFVFPGVGLGVIGSGATKVHPSFFTAAAHAVAEQIPEHDLDKGQLLPQITQLKKVSMAVALAVGEKALAEDSNLQCRFSTFQHNGDPVKLKSILNHMHWSPSYLPIKLQTNSTKE